MGRKSGSRQHGQRLGFADRVQGHRRLPLGQDLRRRRAVFCHERNERCDGLFFQPNRFAGYETNYYNYYGWPNYWEGEGLWGAGDYPAFTPVDRPYDFQSYDYPRWDDKVIGYLQTGQVLLKPPTPARFRVVVNQLTEWGTSFDLPHLKLAYFGTRVMAKPQYDSIINLLNIFSQHLAALSNRVMIEQTAAEAPVIIRARAYISEHHGEAMRMRVVAQAVHTSTFYFCKVFKRATGLTYTEYVSRVRIESVKRQLLDRHLRVSEAAYAAGFQSLSQFNRVFRRIEGESPSHYRDQLHTPLAISAHFAPRAA